MKLCFKETIIWFNEFGPNETGICSFPYKNKEIKQISLISVFSISYLEKEILKRQCWPTNSVYLLSFQEITPKIAMSIKVVFI